MIVRVRLGVLLAVVVHALLGAHLTGCGGHVDLGSDRRDDAGDPPLPVEDTYPLPRDAARDGDSRDTTGSIADGPCEAPVFPGIRSIGSISDTGVVVVWDAATHGTTPSSDITYEVFVSMSPTDLFGKPPAVTVVGVLDAVVSGLTPETTYSFAVRAFAPDKCGDANFVVKTITTKPHCNYLAVQAIYDRNCAVSGCHVLPAPPSGMVLSSGFSYGNTVGVASVQDPASMRIKAGDSESSYLYRKMTGRPATGFNTMPPPGATSLPTAEEKDLIKCWIDLGASP